jgi:hypothetical protein
LNAVDLSDAGLFKWPQGGAFAPIVTTGLQTPRHGILCEDVLANSSGENGSTKFQQLSFKVDFLACGKLENWHAACCFYN